MKLYSRYIFNKTFVGFAGCISILISLIWFSRAITFVKYVTENGIAINQFFYLFLLILPWLLLFIIPISVLAAVLIVYNRLITTNELAILKNAGLTKFSLSKPAILLTLICTIICYSISFYFMPYANKKLRMSRSDLANNYTNLSINPKTFESLRTLTIYVKNRDENNQLFGILLHDKRNRDYSSTITAESGHIVAQENSALLYMENGTVQKFNYDTKKSEILLFDNYVFNLTDDEQTNSSIRWKQKERYLSELINYESDISDIEAARLKSELHQRFTYPLIPLVFTLIALASIMRGSFSRRGNSKNIAIGAIASTLFLTLTITICQMMEKFPKLIFLLYTNFFLFSVLSIYFLYESTQRTNSTNTTQQ